MTDKHSLFQKLIANTLLCTFFTSIVIGNPALANSFDDGQAIGQSSTSSIATGISDGSSLSLLPKFGSSGTSDLRGNYPGDGRDSATSVSDLMAKGTTVQEESCAEGDQSCSARSYATERYGAAQDNDYQSIAQTMNSTEQGRNPEDVLGLDNVPTEGGSSVCVESTTTLPDGTKEETCLDATLQQTTYFTKLPTTVGNTYTTPSCLDPGFILSADRTECVKETFSCPVGSTIQGGTAPPLYISSRQSDDRIYISKEKGANSTVGKKYVATKPFFVAFPTVTHTISGKIINGVADIYMDNQLIKSVTGTYSFTQAVSEGNRSLRVEITPSSIGASSFALSVAVPAGTFVQPNIDLGERAWWILESNATWLFEGEFVCKKNSGTELACKPATSLCSPGSDSCCKINITCSKDKQQVDLHWQTCCRDSGTYHYDIQTMRNNSVKWWPYYNNVVKCDDKGKCDLYFQNGYCGGGGVMGGSNITNSFNMSSIDVWNYFPATKTLEKATPGCLGSEVVSAGQVVVSDETLISGTQSGGTMTCEAELYSCPAGMAMNGALCEDVNRLQYTNNPDCVNLGYIPDTDTEGFLCVTQELTECALMPADCVETGSTCVYTDKMEASPTFGECLATERTMECPVAGETIVSESCGFKPMCIDGNCFEQESKCPIIPGVNPIQHYDEVCQNLTKETIESCPVTYTYGAPDEDGENHIIGAEVDTNTCTWSNDATCTVAPIQMITDSEGVATWPTEANFSCLGDTMALCDELEADTECTLTSSSDEQFSIDGGTPIVVAKHFDCARTLMLPTDTCTDDFAKMAVSMEASRQAGEYLDVDNLKIFGGEFHRCDRRSAGFGGASVGSKSCCNISAPDPENNHDVLAEAKSSIGMQGAMSLIDYSVDSGSSYVYDFMMDDSFFQEVSTKLFSAAETAASTASQADMLAEQTSEFSSASYGVSYAGIGIAYTGTATATAAGTTVAGGATGTSSMSLGGGFQLQFSPVGLYIYAAIKLYQAYQAALACDDEDYKTSTLSEGKLCYTYGTWCEKEESGVFGSTCVKYRTGKCCFNSKLARIINEQGRKQLGLDMENCGGFTVAQIGELDWSKIDLSEFISDMLEQAQKNLPTASDLQRLNDKIINNVNASSSGGTQPIDLGVNGNKRIHN